MASTAFERMTLEEMTARLSKYSTADHLALVRKAYCFAEKVHAGQTRRSGEAYVSHPIHVASTLVELQLDAGSVAAALLHDTVEDVEGVTFDLIEKEFGSEIRDLVDGVTKLGQLDFMDREE
ncbi:MAG TPA: HD domain-containing protein, partial [Clostridia bacterium]|nr:HD domain-containing protein [Clostridia bacterium]